MNGGVQAEWTPEAIGSSLMLDSRTSQMGNGHNASAAKPIAYVIRNREKPRFPFVA
jgi:hypothetical protein